MKRIVTIQDISGVGKCSVTVALPIVSAMGVECAVMPTAVLSTHTMFSGFTFCDLTQELPKMAKHWKEQNLGFDAIYTGYLGSFEQLAFVDQFISDFRQKGNLVVIDPVMGDDGELYYIETYNDGSLGENCFLALGKLDGEDPSKSTFVNGFDMPDSFSSMRFQGKDIINYTYAHSAVRDSYIIYFHINMLDTED